MFSCERPEVISLFLQGWFSVFAFFCWVRLIGTVVFQRYYDAVNVVISVFFMFSIPSPYLYIFSFSVLLICCFLKEWFTWNFNYFSLRVQINRFTNFILSMFQACFRLSQISKVKTWEAKPEKIKKAWKILKIYISKSKKENWDM